ncbi:MAG: caspase family protein [bacterium]|nr:caspase family protein [bacterium]
MKRKALLLLSTAVCLILPTTAGAAGKHALLIGIQDYSYHSGFASLRGPENDLRITKQVLRERFGFQEKNFLVLLNEEASHSGIEHAFKALIESVRPGDFVYIYYSGHGSQTDDLNDDELDGRDETWLSYGSRKDESEHKDNYDVLDDEIEAWLAVLYEKSHNVVFVSDSCHSATVSRGQAAISRVVESDTRSHPLGKNSYVQAAKHPGVRVGAARDRESAIEIPIEDDRYYGLFTWYWVRALQQARDGESWNDLFKRVYTQVTAGRGEVQHPQLWGERSLQIVSGGFTPIKATIPVTKVNDNMVAIGAGYLSGVTIGSTYHLDAPGNPNPPTLTIEKIKTSKSLGKAEGHFKKGDLVLEESHVYGLSPIRVYLDADDPEGANKPLLQAIRSVFDTPALPAYTFSGNPQQAELHLYLLRPRQENDQYIHEANDVLPKSFPEQPLELWILTPEHRLLNEKLRIQFSELSPEPGLQVLQKSLKKFARTREIKALGSSCGSTLQIEAEAHILTPDF